MKTVKFRQWLVVACYALIDLLVCFGLIYAVDTVLAVRLASPNYQIAKALMIWPVFAVMGMYPGISLSPAEVVQRIFIGAFSWAGLNFVIFYVKDRVNTELVLVVYVAMGLVVFLAVYVLRALMRHRFQRKDWWGIPVVVVGAGNSGQAVIRSLRQNHGLGLRPVAAFDDDPGVCEPGDYCGVPVYQGLEKVDEYIASHPVGIALVAMPRVDRARVSDLVDTHLKNLPKVIMLLDTPGLLSFGLRPRDFGGILAYETEQRLLFTSSRLVKRSVELAVVLAGCVFALPLMLLIALGIKLDSRGPVFYGHTRIGRNNRNFKAWKFRTMHTNGDQILKELLERDPAVRAEWEQSQKLKDDPRVTRFGAFLRKTSLDEIPQLFNIIIGQMSLIGPRPIVEKERAKFGVAFPLINSVRPGLTGLWQVSGRSDTDYGQRVQLDSYYVRNWSLWLDGYIFLKTFAVVLTGKGAY